MSILQDETRRIKNDSLKESVSFPGMLWTKEKQTWIFKNQSMVQTKKLEQNSISELLGTSINWFLATSQPYQGFSH